MAVPIFRDLYFHHGLLSNSALSPAPGSSTDSVRTGNLAGPSPRSGDFPLSVRRPPDPRPFFCGARSQRAASRLLGWLWAVAVLFALSTFFAFTQSPRPNPLQPSAAFPSLDWWKHPIERNAMWRLDRVTTDMRGVFALLDGRHAWAVGRNGTILATADGGASWASGPSNLSLGGVFLALGVRYPMVLARKTRPRGRFRPLPQDAVTDFVDFLSS